MERFRRQIQLSEWGEKAQKAVSQSSALVIGAGGLGCPVLLNLSLAGIGTLGLVEGDEVSLDNLHRQSLYSESDIGSSKLTSALKRLKAHNSEVNYLGWEEFLNLELALEIIPHFDLVIDCTDNFPTRYLLDDVCNLYGKVWMSGSIHRNEVQLSSYGWKNRNSFSEVFPESEKQWLQPNCSEAGVLGPVVSMAGSFMANEAMSILGRDESLWAGKLYLLNPMSMQLMDVELPSKERAPITIEQIRSKNYRLNLVCSIPSPYDISLHEWKNLKGSKFQLNVGSSDFISPADNKVRLSELSTFHPSEKSEKVLVYCERGKTSKQALGYLIEKFPDKEWYSLKNGMKSYE